MFIEINGDTYNTFLIQMVYKDGLKIIYHMSNGVVIKEEFESITELTKKYNSLLGKE